MKTKICTSLEQSKKLVELGLSSDTADFWYHSKENEYGPGVYVLVSKELTNGFKYDDFFLDDIPAWSLSRLLVIIRDFQCVWLGANDVASWVTEFNLGSGKHYATDPTTDPLDAAYTCLVWLIENGKIDPKNITT